MIKRLVAYLLNLLGPCHSGSGSNCCTRTRFHFGKHRAFNGDTW